MGMTSAKHCGSGGSSSSSSNRLQHDSRRQIYNIPGTYCGTYKRIPPVRLIHKLFSFNVSNN